MGALRHIENKTLPLRQPVPRRMADDEYLAWLYDEANAAKAELVALMTRALSLLNDAEVTTDITKRLEEEDGRIPQALLAFVQRFDTTVHRSKTSRRPYWKMGPVKKRDRVLAKAAADWEARKAAHVSHHGSRPLHSVF